MEFHGWSFVCGSAARADLVFFARERDDLTQKGIVATTFNVWNEKNPNPDLRWSIYDTVVEWRAQGMAIIMPAVRDRVVVALGTKSQYFEVEPATAAQYLGVIQPSVLVRRVAAIDDVVFAAGMGRAVIRRDGRGAWVQFGPGISAADQGRIVGFEGIDGFSVDDIYVAGWNGEIWRWQDAVWRRIDSPTNANLNAVACAPDGAVYVVGDNGNMLRGAGDLWTVIETNRPENLMDVAAFEADIFVVTDYKILRLTPAGLVPDDRFMDEDRPATCLHLLRASDGVLSLGPKDLFAFTGGVWRRII
jgi:hypothetical protein